MSALIKGGDQARLSQVRSVETGGRFANLIEQTSSPAANDSRLSELEQLLAEARSALETMRRESEQRLEIARIEAHAEGVKEGRAASEDLLQGLADAGARAVAASQTALRNSAAAGLLIARSSVSRIFSENISGSAMIADIIEKRLEVLDRALVVRIRVSAGDFPDRQSLKQVEERSRGIEILIDENLSSGECLFDLHIGEVEIGPRLQARRLLEFLDEQIVREGEA